MELKYLAIIVLLTAVFGALIVGVGKLPLAISSTYTPVYCNDYSFTCCSDNFQESSQTVLLDYSNTGAYTCPAYATRCNVNYIAPSWTSPVWLSKTKNFGACTYHNDILSKGYTCPDQTVLGQATGFSGDIQKGETIFLQIQGGSLSTLPKGNPTITVYKSRLVFCGRAACDAGTTGVVVSGSDGCAFQTNNNIYSTGGQLVKQSVGTISYTVPGAQCVLSYQSGDRHACGNIEEQCSADSDCTGHTYGNKECIGRTLQTYGCRQLADPNTAIDYATGYVLEKDLSYTKSRCEIASSTNVQCCGDTDCGTNAFCDHTSWTCKQQVQCTQNSDCGVSSTCDYTTKEIKTPICSSGQCAYKTQATDCCNDANCPSGYICGTDNKCKQSTSPKTQCTFSCCISESGYFDKPCASGQTCCGDHTCQESCGVDNQPPADNGKNRCEESGGTWVDQNKESCTLWVFCSKTATSYCKLAHTPIASIILMIIGGMIFGLSLWKLEDENKIIVAIVAAIIFIIGLAWLILAQAGIL